MAKFKLHAGAEIDMLTAPELREVLQSWRTELTRGPKLRRLSIIGVTDGAGALEMGDNNDGPSEGMAWAVTRLSVAPGPTLAAAGLQVYANAVSPGSLMLRNLSTDIFCGDHGLNLLGGDSLRIAGAGITVSTQVVVTMSIKEVPIQQAWSL